MAEKRRQRLQPFATPADLEAHSADKGDGIAATHISRTAPPHEAQVSKGPQLPSSFSPLEMHTGDPRSTGVDGVNDGAKGFSLGTSYRGEGRALENNGQSVDLPRVSSVTPDSASQPGRLPGGGKLGVGMRSEDSKNGVDFRDISGDRRKPVRSASAWVDDDGDQHVAIATSVKQGGNFDGAALEASSGVPDGSEGSGGAHISDSISSVGVSAWGDDGDEGHITAVGATTSSLSRATASGTGST